jgi:hypothetical protein
MAAGFHVQSAARRFKAMTGCEAGRGHDDRIRQDDTRMQSAVSRLDQRTEGRVPRSGHRSSHSAARQVSLGVGGPPSPFPLRPGCQGVCPLEYGDVRWGRPWGGQRTPSLQLGGPPTSRTAAPNDRAGESGLGGPPTPLGLLGGRPRSDATLKDLAAQFNSRCAF